MPKASRETATETIHGAGFDGCYEDFAGGYTVGFETFTEDVDMTPRLKGLPDDLCPCPHWGYVLKGRLTYTHDGTDETFGAGDAFYVPAGHTVAGDAGTELVFFSPTTEWEETLGKIAKRAPQLA